MQLTSAKTRLVILFSVKVASLFLLSSVVNAQEQIEENIRPVGQVCLAGQACEGASTGSATSTATPTTAAAVVETVVETVVEADPEPTAAVSVTAEQQTEAVAFDPAAAYQMSCFACHSSGAAGAPVVGEADAWAERTAKGMDAVMANVINGVNAMPAKGMCMDCTDDSLRSIVDYMISQ